MNLIGEYKSALQICESDLIKRSRERKYKGMEKVYHTALAQVLENNRRFSRITSEVRLEDIAGRVVDGRSRGRVDLVIESKNSNFHAIELKVAQLPRERHMSPKSALYDIGQITRDFLRLEGAKKLTSFDCVIVLHGVLLSVYNTRKALLREFHNRMFVDFKTSEKDGELRFEKTDPLRMKQKRLIKQLGLDQPFTQLSDPMCALTGQQLGLIIIHGPLH